jgi:hypothetical protein
MFLEMASFYRYVGDLHMTKDYLERAKA